MVYHHHHVVYRHDDHVCLHDVDVVNVLGLYEFYVF
jgi:hypothetical protein